MRGRDKVGSGFKVSKMSHVKSPKWISYAPSLWPRYLGKVKRVVGVEN